MAIWPRARRRERSCRHRETDQSSGWLDAGRCCPRYLQAPIATSERPTAGVPASKLEKRASEAAPRSGARSGPETGSQRRQQRQVKRPGWSPRPFRLGARLAGGRCHAWATASMAESTSDPIAADPTAADAIVADPIAAKGSGGGRQPSDPAPPKSAMPLPHERGASRRSRPLGTPMKEPTPPLKLALSAAAVRCRLGHERCRAGGRRRHERPERVSAGAAGDPNAWCFLSFDACGPAWRPHGERACRPAATLLADADIYVLSRSCAGRLISRWAAKDLRSADVTVA
jgi:hypothetical protein